MENLLTFSEGGYYQMPRAKKQFLEGHPLYLPSISLQ